jgi:hypothetical protein
MAEEAERLYRYYAKTASAVGNIQRVYCPICHETFDSYWYLHNHMDEVHLPENQTGKTKEHEAYHSGDGNIKGWESEWSSNTVDSGYTPNEVRAILRFFRRYAK